VNPALQGYLAAMEESLAATDGLADAGSELAAVADLVDGNTQLTLAVNDGSVPVASRRALLDHLLEGKVRPEVRSLVHQAVTVVPAGELTASFHWLASRVAQAAGREPVLSGEPEAEEVLGRMGSRNRVSGYAAAVFETVTVAELEEIEDQLFRFARTVEANRRLRGALGDRDLPVHVRQQVITQLLGTQVLPATLRLAAYAVRGGRARDIVSTLDALVEDAARARGWRVARVQAAHEVDESQRRSLSDALAHLAGNPVDLQVTVDPDLLGGVVVQVGDLLVDSSTRHRLDELKEHLLVSEAAYQTPQAPTPPAQTPQTRNATDD
jgi:F-type H+-transporting ATPase subunit delta